MIATYKFDTENGSNTKHMILAPDKPVARPCRISVHVFAPSVLESVNRNAGNGIETASTFVIGG